jgi:hypothetical protein
VTLVEPDASMPQLRQRSAFSVYEKSLLLLFLLTLPLVNPWVRGDGVGYYAYVRALLIERTLRFERDWLAANPTFQIGRVDSDGKVKADQYTSTGHLNNHFSVGPAILWAPFLGATHIVVLGLNKLGAHIPADGYSRPYLVTMALATAIYGFLGLYLAFHLARKYFEERWAFLGTLGIWFASPLPVYMYFNPSWSHAHSAFAVSLFLWYWHRTRQQRTRRQWALLGLASGLMVNVYYLNALFLLIPFLEALGAYRRAWDQPGYGRVSVRRLLSAHTLYIAAVVLALLPTLVTRQIIYGSPFKTGYPRGGEWFWTAPQLWQLLISSNHGLLSWTPILTPAVFGLFLFRKHDKHFAIYLLVIFLTYYYVIASYSTWHGIASYGNRFFVSFTPVFVLGLTASVMAFARLFEYAGRAFAAAGMVTALFILWNVGLMFQWGMHMIPVRGPISWREMVYNQVDVVPGKMVGTVKSYLVARKALMGEIEQRDVNQMPAPGSGVR